MNLKTGLGELWKMQQTDTKSIAEHLRYKNV